MKTVILAGGLGTRISEETGIRPKPMVEIGGYPILWHIMKTYSAHGINDFVICCGYKSHVIKEYFATYHLRNADVTFDLKSYSIDYHRTGTEPWKVTLIETGMDTMTGGRLKRVKDYIGNDTFCFTYGDGLTDLNITKLIAFHKEQKTLATMTAVQPPGRFGAFTLAENQTKVTRFHEKQKGDGAWINGGYFVLEPAALDYIEDDSTVWEKGPMQNLTQNGELAAYKYTGFWQNMDTLRDKLLLEDLWKNGNAAWKVWK